MASAIGAFIAAMGYDALDDGDIATLEAHFEAALAVKIAGEQSVIPSASLIHVGSDTGAINAMVADVTPDVSAWVDGQVYIIRPHYTNTSAVPTFSPDGLAAKTIVRPDGTSLLAGEIVGGAKCILIYDSTLDRVVLAAVSRAYVDAAVAAVGVAAQATRLMVTSTSDTTVEVTADAAVLVSAAGAMTVHRSVAVSASMSSAGAGGLDTGSVLSPSSWYHVWLVSNGTTVAALLSASSTAPTLPDGYVYKLRLGAVHTDASGDLWRTRQYGNRTTVRTGTNPAVAPLIASGPAGSYSGTTVTWSTVSLSAFVPPTARSALLIPSNYRTATGGCYVWLASSTAMTTIWGANPPLWGADQSYDASSAVVEVPMETAQTAYWYAGNGNGALNLHGWVE